MSLHTYEIITKHGLRPWEAEDADHAREQHGDAFPDEPILQVQAAPRLFDTMAEARAVADEITAMPRKGKAWPQRMGFYDGKYVIEIRPRANPYGNPRILRWDGTAVGYVEWADSFRPIEVFPSLTPTT